MYKTQTSSAWNIEGAKIFMEEREEYEIRTYYDLMNHIRG